MPVAGSIFVSFFAWAILLWVSFDQKMNRVSALPPQIGFTSTEAVWRAVFLAGKKRVAKEVLADEQA